MRWIFVEIDILGAAANHSRRVAYIALRIADVLHLSDDEKSDLVMYSVMHDNGLAEEVIVTSMKLSEMKRIERMEGLKAHCDFGQKIFFTIPSARKRRILSNIIMKIITVADFSD